MKTKVPAILLNSDFFTKPRNRKWISEQGAEGVIILQAFWIASSQEADCKIKRDDVEFISFPIFLPKEKILQILDSAVLVGLLDQKDGFFFNSQIVENHKTFITKRDNYRKGVKKRERILPESSKDSERILEESSKDYIIPIPISITNTKLDIKENSQAEKPDPELVEFIEFPKIKLTDPEYQKLSNRYQAEKLPEKALNRGLEILDAYIFNNKKGQKYKSHYHVLIGWVLEQVKKEFKITTIAPIRQTNFERNMEILRNS